MHSAHPRAPGFKNIGLNRILLTGTEYWKDAEITITTTPVQFAAYVAPASMDLTYCGAQAHLWNKHKPRALTVHYVPLVAATEGGMLGLAYNQDIEDADPQASTAIRQLMTYAGSAIFPVSRPFSWRVPFGRIVDDLFISSHTDSEFRLVSAGQIYLFNAGGCTAKQYGTFMLSYDWELEGRQIENGTAPSIGSGPSLTIPLTTGDVVKDFNNVLITGINSVKQLKSLQETVTLIGQAFTEVKASGMPGPLMSALFGKVAADPGPLATATAFTMTNSWIPLLVWFSPDGVVTFAKAPTVYGYGFTNQTPCTVTIGGHNITVPRYYIVSPSSVGMPTHFFQAMIIPPSGGPVACGATGMALGTTMDPRPYLIQFVAAASNIAQSLSMTVDGGDASIIFLSPTSSSGLPLLAPPGAESDSEVDSPELIMPVLAPPPSGPQPPSAAAPAKRSKLF